MLEAALSNYCHFIGTIGRSGIFRTLM